MSRTARKKMFGEIVLGDIIDYITLTTDPGLELLVRKHIPVPEHVANPNQPMIKVFTDILPLLLACQDDPTDLTLVRRLLNARFVSTKLKDDGMTFRVAKDALQIHTKLQTSNFVIMFKAIVAANFDRMILPSYIWDFEWNKKPIIKYLSIPMLKRYMETKKFVLDGRRHKGGNARYAFRQYPFTKSFWDYDRSPINFIAALACQYKSIPDFANNQIAKVKPWQRNYTGAVLDKLGFLTDDNAYDIISIMTEVGRVAFYGFTDHLPLVNTFRLILDDFTNLYYGSCHIENWMKLLEYKDHPQAILFKNAWAYQLLQLFCIMALSLIHCCSPNGPHVDMTNPIARANVKQIMYHHLFGEFHITTAIIHQLRVMDNIERRTKEVAKYDAAMTKFALFLGLDKDGHIGPKSAMTLWHYDESDPVVKLNPRQWTEFIYDNYFPPNFFAQPE